jgi:uncharacterized membrane protein YhaH (DUF805 family)
MNCETPGIDLFPVVFIDRGPDSPVHLLATWVSPVIRDWPADIRPRFRQGTYNEEFGIGIFGGIFWVLALYPLVSVFVKRIHDRDRAGWFFLLLFVPLVNLWPVVEIYFLKGTEGENQYGPDPLG